MLAILPALLGLLGPVLDKLIPDADKRAEVQAEFQRAALANEASLNAAMAEVMKADASSESWLARSARPFTVFWGLAMVTWIGVAAPLLGVQKEALAALQGVPSDLWNLVSVGVGAYMLTRTADKLLPGLVNKSK